MSVDWIGVKGQHQLAPLVPCYLLFLSNFLTEHIPLMLIPDRCRSRSNSIWSGR